MQEVREYDVASTPTQYEESEQGTACVVLQSDSGFRPFDHCRNAHSNPMIVGSRVYVLPGPGFEDIAPGYVGTVLHLHDEGGTCSVAFDCLNEPRQISLQHLQFHSGSGSVQMIGHVDHCHDVPPTSPADTESQITIESSVGQSPILMESTEKSLTRTSSSAKLLPHFIPSATKSTRPPMVPPLPLPLNHSPDSDHDDYPDVHSFSMCNESLAEDPEVGVMGSLIPPQNSAVSAARGGFFEEPDEFDLRLQDFMRGYSEAVEQRFQELDERLRRFVQARFDAWGDAWENQMCENQSRINLMVEQTQSQMLKEITAVSQQQLLPSAAGFYQQSIDKRFVELDKRFAELQSGIDSLRDKCYKQDIWSTSHAELQSGIDKRFAELQFGIDSLRGSCHQQDQSYAELQRLVETIEQRASRGIDLGQKACDDLGVIATKVNDAVFSVQQINAAVSKQSQAYEQRWNSFGLLESQVHAHIRIAQEKHNLVDYLCNSRVYGSVTNDMTPPRRRLQEGEQELPVNCQTPSRKEALKLGPLRHRLQEGDEEQPVNCQTPSRKEAQACPHCGAVLSFREGDRFCGKCGKASPPPKAAKIQGFELEEEVSRLRDVRSTVQMHNMVAQDIAKQFQAAIAEVHSDATLAEASLRQDRSCVLSRLRSELDHFQDNLLTATDATSTTNLASPICSGGARSSSAPVRERSRPPHKPNNENVLQTIVFPQSPTSGSDASVLASATLRCGPLRRVASPTRGLACSPSPAVRTPSFPSPCTQFVPPATTTTTAATILTTNTVASSQSASMTCAMCGNMCMDVAELCRRCTLNSNQPGATPGAPSRMAPPRRSWAMQSPPPRSRLSAS